MELTFSKFQATGNDFIMISDPDKRISLDSKQCETLCDRKFGVGADGVIIIRPSESSDFEVIYYNPDGTQSLCGNGSRSAVVFAKNLNLFANNKTTFLAYDGMHKSEILSNGEVKLQMNDVQSVRVLEDGMFIDTGSPHLVRFVPDLVSTDVEGKGRELRYNTPIEGGTNVNFVEIKDENTIAVRTYERGVEQETLSCGTGVTAAALAASGREMKSPIAINVKGGNLIVSFTKIDDNKFTDIWLTGPAKCVFEGNINL